MHELRDSLRLCFSENREKEYFVKIVSEAKIVFDIDVYAYENNTCGVTLYQNVDGKIFRCWIGGGYDEDLGGKYKLNLISDDYMGKTYRYNLNFNGEKNIPLHC